MSLWCLFWVAMDLDPLLGQFQHEGAVLLAPADGASATSLNIFERGHWVCLAFGMGWLLWAMVCLLGYKV